MSWSIKLAALGAVIGAAVEEKLAHAKQYHGSESQHAVIDSVVAQAKAFGETYPDKLVLVSSQGHMDPHWGNASTSFELVHVAEPVVPEPAEQLEPVGS